MTERQGHIIVGIIERLRAQHVETLRLQNELLALLAGDFSSSSAALLATLPPFAVDDPDPLLTARRQAETAIISEAPGDG